MHFEYEGRGYGLWSVSERREIDQLKKILETHATLFPNYAHINP